MPIDQLVGVLDSAIKRLEQRDFISESDKVTIHKITEINSSKAKIDEATYK